MHTFGKRVLLSTCPDAQRLSEGTYFLALAETPNHEIHVAPLWLKLRRLCFLAYHCDDLMVALPSL